MISATKSHVKWDKQNRSVTDDEAAEVLANGHPKSNTPPTVLPGSPGSGEAPGASGPPTTGAAVGPGGPLGST